MTGFNVISAKRISMASTVVDAALAFARGRRKRGLVLLGAAALSSRVPGLGTVASVLVRLADRLR
jgi:hypothetical protein